ncbi:hypothetical protein [Vibrio parahaemolyticus]|uniref:hypothetical protein n=1 Tax=Vibrio parahaemolyticus TaxID=670 RepID=UPI001122EC10|nr:hypothetical protein [Vibrio parahaemolyticus]TOG04940.1 hypothetical protein CGJ09_23045 [Vibrio parahaemolyticus]
MTVPKPNIYELQVVASDERSSFTIKNSEGKEGFCREDIVRGGKIYMVTENGVDGTVRYVGQTVQSIQKRLYQGITNQTYTWSKRSYKYELFVWNLSGLVDSEPTYALDSIESELAFAVKLHQRDWPINQTSIKFRWFRSTSIGSTAQSIAPVMIDQFYENLLYKYQQRGKDTSSIEKDRSDLQTLLRRLVL